MMPEASKIYFGKLIKRWFTIIIMLESSEGNEGGGTGGGEIY